MKAGWLHMNYKVLYRKYRPQDFDSMVGQEYTTGLLKNAIIDNKISHAYIFTGPRGTGKTSTARIFAKAINCLHPNDGNPCNECEMCKQIGNNPDIVEIDAASNNGVDEIRELINNVRLAPSMAKYKVYIIDEFHMLSTSAFNALLLTLEEPPANVVFILATTDIQNVPITILSRCQRFDFKLISNEKIISRLKFICKEEKIKISDDALMEIAYLSNGGLRDALSILDQISSLDKDITADDVTTMFGSISNGRIIDLIDSIENNNANGLISLIDTFRNDGINFAILANKLIINLKELLVELKNNDSTCKLSFDDVFNMTLDINKCLNESNNNSNPYNLLEIILLKYVNNTANCPQATELQQKSDSQVNTEEIETNKLEKNDDEENSNSANKCMLNIDARVNNCFSNASKESLTTVKKKWNDFIIYESNANKKLLSYILDTDIVAASNEYGIIVNNMDSTVSLLNEFIESLESDFRVFYGFKYKLVALNASSWKKYKEDYIYHLKNHIKYDMIEENILNNNVQSENNSSQSNDLEKLANEIFGNDIEVK
jgi:DNA polymerase-3 subunit gamma/tau